MSLRIIKAGLFDSVQDTGRYGYQHLGINPTGAMDRYAAQLANALLEQDLAAPVIEMHFPSAQILFEQAAIICITGAHFSPTINGKDISINQPYLISANAVLKFTKPIEGARAYLAVNNGLKVDKWLGSYSTNTKATAGGFNGRRLMKDDVIHFERQIDLPTSNDILFTLPWKQEIEKQEEVIKFIKGPEWDWLTDQSKEKFQNASFQITSASDRMGYRLSGQPLGQAEARQLISSVVTFGTVQLLPDGQLIVLMADHQTTGGYPRIANIISAHLPALAQTQPGAIVHFAETSLHTAEEKAFLQQDLLYKIQNECKLRIQNWLDGKH